MGKWLALSVVYGSVVVAMIVYFVVTSIRQDRKLRLLAAERQGDSICRFARSLDYRRLDTKVIRAVYEGLQEWLRSSCPAFPVHPSDDIDRDYLMDPEDFEDLVCEIADRLGRSLEGYEWNPHHPKIHTVSGLIEFLCAQPKVSAS